MYLCTAHTHQIIKEQILNNFYMLFFPCALQKTYITFLYFILSCFKII